MFACTASVPSLAARAAASDACARPSSSRAAAASARSAADRCRAASACSSRAAVAAIAAARSSAWAAAASRSRASTALISRAWSCRAADSSRAASSRALAASRRISALADVAATLHGDLGQLRAVGLEHTFHPFAMRHLAYRERRVQAPAALGDDHTLEGLEALTLAFLDLDLHLDGVARAKLYYLRDRTGKAARIKEKLG